MTAATADPIGRRAGAASWPTILAAGLAAGIVDFAYASGVAVVSGRPALSPWRAVAAGWMGPAAGQAAVAPAVGMATHFGIATAMAAVYVLAVRRLPIVKQMPLATAPIYGLGLYGVMYLGVLPLRWPAIFPRWQGVSSILDILAHVAVALAIAAVAGRRPGRVS